jgi:hypothetical protein
MFERYTEKARRIIFFARYEASQFGSPFIETEHLLLGLLREDRALAERVHLNPALTRQEVESRTSVRERTSTSVDLPLSAASKRVLAYASEEATGLNHDFIDTGHLLLGLMREESSISAIMIRQQGLNSETAREIVRVSAEATHRPPRPVERPGAWDAPQPIQAAAPSLMASVLRLQELVEGAFQHLVYSDAYGEQRLKRKPWSRKEAVGHLIDWATTHHQWLGRALTQPQLIASGYPMEEWVSAEYYQRLSWPALADLWVSMNNLLIHVIAVIPEQKVNTACRVGITDTIPLAKLIDQYVAYTEDIVGQILAKL